MRVEVLLAHREADHADVAAVSLEQRDGHGVRIGVSGSPRTSPSRCAFGGTIVGVRDVGDHDVVPAADQLDLGQRLRSMRRRSPDRRAARETRRCRRRGSRRETDSSGPVWYAMYG